MPEDAPKPTLPRTARAAAILALLTLGAVVLVRVLGPSDLNANQDQSKTVAFTLDAARNGNWSLPQDGMGALTRKPPLVNWVGAPLVMLGWHSELALKTPALLAGVATFGATVAGALVLFRRLGRDGADPGDVALARHALPAALAAGAVWVACPSSVKHIYFMRPDIMITAWLAIGWAAAVMLVTGPAPRRPRLLALVVWTSAGLAALTKGPMAVLLPAYLLLAGILIADHPSRRAWSARAKRTARAGWWWGIPIMLALPGAWLYAAWLENAEHVEGTLLGKAVKGRLVDDAGGLSKKLYALTRGVPGLLFERYMVWAVPLIIALLSRPSRAILSHPTAPASVFVLLVLLVNVLTAGRAGSYLMPAYPAASCLAVYALARLIAGAAATRMPAAPACIAAAALVVGLAIGARESFFSRAARQRDGDAINTFARQAAAIVDDDPVAFLGITDLPIAPLMGRHHAGDSSPQLTAAASWLIALDDHPAVAGLEPELVTQPLLLPVGVTEPRPDTPEGRTPVGLYRAPTPP